MHCSYVFLALTQWYGMGFWSVCGRKYVRCYVVICFIWGILLFSIFAYSTLTSVSCYIAHIFHPKLLANNVGRCSEVWNSLVSVLCSGSSSYNIIAICIPGILNILLTFTICYWLNQLPKCNEKYSSLWTWIHGMTENQSRRFIWAELLEFILWWYWLETNLIISRTDR